VLILGVSPSLAVTLLFVLWGHNKQGQKMQTGEKQSGDVHKVGRGIIWEYIYFILFFYFFYYWP
jgi:hypothetical protein